MKSLTSLKITQRVKQGLYEYCAAFYKAKERYPTIAEMNEAFYIPNFLDLDTQQEVSEAVISKTANMLTEGAVARTFRPEVFRPERMDRETRERGEAGASRARRSISPEMIDIFNAGKSPEEAGIDPAEFIQNLTPAEFVQYQTNRQKAIDAGSPVTTTDHQLDLRTPQTPNEKPAEKKDERKDTDRQAAVWASERLGQIKSGEVKDMSPLDHALVAVDNVVGWVTGKGKPTSKGVAAPVEEPPAEEEVPTTRPPEVEPSTPERPKTPDEVPVEEPVEIPTEKPSEKPTETPTPQPKEKPVETPKEKPVEVPVEEPIEKPDEETETVPAIIPVEKPKEKPEEITDRAPEKKVEEKTKTKEVTEPARKLERKTEDRVERKEKAEEKRKPKEKEEKKPSIAAAAPSKSRPEESKKETEPDTDSSPTDQSGIDLERYHALRAGLGGVQVVQEGVYDPKRSLQKKEKKQKFKVVVTKEGGKKVEIFASSLRGVKRIVYGKQNFRVFNQSGSDMTTYFKKNQKGK